MSKITSFVNDVDLNEVTSLVNQLESFKDDAGFGIISISISTLGGMVCLRPNLFFAKFTDFTVVKVKESPDYPYELISEINGVTFSALLSDACVREFKKSRPDQIERLYHILENREKSVEKKPTSTAMRVS